MPDPFFVSQRDKLVELAARHAMSAIYPFRVFPGLGGLMSHGISVPDLNEQGTVQTSTET